MSYVMDFEILVLNNYKRRAMSQVLELRGNDGHWETDLEYYRTVTFIVMTMHYDRKLRLSQKLLSSSSCCLRFFLFGSK